MPARGTFVLGMGAQRAGSTWLDAFLRRSRAYDGGFRKEYHVFDAIDLASDPHEAWMLRRISYFARREVDHVAAGEPADADMLHRLAMCADTERYFDYFASLLDRDPEVRATGDLTPDHAMLSAARLRDIRASFAARDIRTVAVFVMRDPVERVWSHIRMKAHRTPAQFDRPTAEVLRDQHGDPSYAGRTRYHETLDALDDAFGPDDVHVGLFETMFLDRTEATAICDLAGIASPPPRLGRVRNAVPHLDVPEETLRAVATTYAPTYRAVAARRPDLDVARWWPHAAHVL